MKAIGGLLIVLGLIGLLLTLIFWLPAKINLPIVLFVSIVCLVSIWGGGKLSLKAVRTREKPIDKYAPGIQQAYRVQHGVACPRCGTSVVHGQKFCGDCGLSLLLYCPACGVAVMSQSKFCGTCGTRLI